MKTVGMPTSKVVGGVEIFGNKMTNLAQQHSTFRVAFQTTNTSELRLYALLTDREPEVRLERVVLG